jgi:hypothetical protein
MASILDNVDTTDYMALIPENQRDPAALAKKAINADAHIKVLETRLDELRQDYLKVNDDSQTRAKLEDLIKRLENPVQQPASNSQPHVNEVREPQIDMNEIDKRLESKLQQFEAEKKALENANTVRAKLKERYGENYSPVVKQQIDELGWTADDFDQMARKSPTAVLRALGADQIRTDGIQAPPRGQTSFGSGKPEAKKTWTYYQALKKENPRIYHDPKTTNEMTEMAIRYGDDFYDGDYNRFGDLGR